MSMGISRMMGGKGRHASMISAAYSAKAEMRFSGNDELRAREDMHASATRWNNSAEGRVFKTSSKKPAPGSASARNRAALETALSSAEKQPMSQKNRAPLATNTRTKAQSSGEKNRASLAAILHD